MLSANLFADLYVRVAAISVAMETPRRGNVTTNVAVKPGSPAAEGGEPPSTKQQKTQVGNNNNNNNNNTNNNNNNNNEELLGGLL